jgi:cyclopropane-fatty-acyl-phospholipid synthase
MEELGPHYARTLAAWRRNLRARWDDARALGHAEEFLRLWEFYLGYCEGGFAERYIGVGQLVFNKPARRDEPLIPPLPSRRAPRVAHPVGAGVSPRPAGPA